MKRAYLILITVATFAFLPACSTHDQQQAATVTTTTATGVAATVDALPPALVLKLQALAAAHPTVAHDLAAVATALNVVSVKVAALPAPDTLTNYLLWVSYLPELGKYTQEFLAIYRTFYPALLASNDALAKIAAVIQATGAR